GMTGSFGSASVNVDFSLQQVAILSLNFGVGGITYALNSGSTPGTFSPSNPQGNGSLTGTCSGGLCSTGLNAALGKFAFVLAGPTTVSGIGVSYTARSALLPLPLAAGAFALK
ncbi:MAG: hypothetical protein ACREUV_04250, partial [Burkholderiales bacterium]